jgi:microcompartment protein CcmK/EutM
MTITTSIKIQDTAINQTFQDVIGTTGGAGTGAKFDVTKTDGVYTVVLDSAVASSGSGYVAGDTITIPGTSLGGLAPSHNLIVTVGTVGAGGKIATFGAVGTGRIGDGVNEMIIEATGSSSKKDALTLGVDLDDLNITIANSVTITHNDFNNVSLKLTDIERLHGKDHSVAFDVKGAAGEMYALLAAAFGSSDVTEKMIGNAIALSDQGYSDVDIAAAILKLDDFAKDALGTSNETVVKQIWKNITGSNPTLAEMKPFVDGLDKGEFSQAQLLEIASNLSVFRDASHLNFDGLALVGINYVPPSV